MTIAFTPWPADLAARYREKGYWLDVPMTHILEQQVAARPNAPAIICGERTFSYADIDASSTRLAAALYRQGLRTYDTALVQLPNVAEFFVTYLALLKLGVAPVNALFSHQRLELLAYAKQIQPKLLIGSLNHGLFANEQFLQELREVAPALGTVVVDAGAHTMPSGALSLADCLAEPADGFVAQPTAADQVAFFQLSGGSTGTPKLIPRTHNDYYYSVRRSVEICGLNPATRFLCALPAGHNYTMSSPGVLGVFVAGGCVVMARDPEPLSCFALIERHQVNWVPLVPPAVALWLKEAPAHRQRLASLKVIQVGGANFAEALARRIPPELGCQLQQVFGMAEGLVNYTRLDDDAERIFTTQGCPMSPDDEVRVMDAQGNQVPQGQPGMLATRGPYTFKGYYLSPEHNTQVFDAEGFYYSGDLVEQDAQGYLRVVGRVKDQINRGGEKIAAAEVENLLLQHPGITHAAVVAIPDELMGEKSCACVVVSDTSLKPAALRKYLRAQGVAEFKLPDRFQFLEQIPLTAVGKIDKQRLRTALQATHSEQV
ncbi:(2,3-dihydroxybenzoyl)adenylate synthase [Pseudomonas japonica]|uniref:(2,3-dihydroxybenzoyl)adenylate synthase n=1 Tax=Pseudomonas japonica TaxID=256466 RepID=UPI0015E2876D|nr:(2,3-dihydroxybenzoyl)adenylate synthase [Pseudomonas japonica]MBA1243056.1 (2,3-dihydroxybenzoyl)adenylate synthase [Pseudomonas japonica]MBA1287625.1 (2,3-dihydroxybenzoyl)adenylate synthase [Pseudomonas japonica]